LQTDLPKFAAGLERFADHWALIADDGRRLTYANLAREADAFAARLNPDARLVLIEGCNEIEAIAAYLGVLRSGRVALLHPQGPDAQASRIAKTFTPDATYTRIAGAWVLEQSGASTPHHADLGLLLSTSGTTGATKLVRLSRAAVDANARSIADYLELSPDARAITSLPIYYSYGLSVLNSHLAVGATILLTSRSVVDDDFWRFAGAQHATSLAGVPHTYELLERGDLLARAPQSLRTLTQAGGRLPPQAIDYPQAEMQKRGGRMFVMYGQTEATARIAYVPAHLLSKNADCIGVAIPGGALSLRGDNGEDVTQSGRAGELIYRGANVMMGYALGRDDLQRGAEIAELATGDIAERTASGLFRIVGRRSRFVKPFGLRVALDEIERTLEAGGRSAMVAGTDTLIAIGVLQKPGAAAPDTDGIAAELADRYKLPQVLFHVMPLAEWPLLPNGKPDLARVLMRAERERAHEQDARPQRSVADVFAAIVRGRTPITPDSSFVSLGGDSMNYVELSLALEELLGELPKGWESLSIAQLDVLRPRSAVARRRSAFVKLDSDILIRCAAIGAIVGHHASTTDILAGGVAALIMLVGFSWARFQREQLAVGQPWTMLRRLGLMILVPYFCLLTLFSVAHEMAPLSAWTLTANYDPELRGFIQPFWFISVYVQASVLLALASLLLPWFRWDLSAAPMRLGLTVLGLSVAAMLILQMTGHTYPSRSVDQILPLMALGWCLAFADTPRRRTYVILAALLVTMCNILGDRSMETPLWRLPIPFWLLQTGWLASAVLLLIFKPRIALPRPVAAAVAAIASASLTIYLTHTAILWSVTKVFDLEAAGILAAVGAIAAGVFGHQFLISVFSRLSPALKAGAQDSSSDDAQNEKRLRGGDWGTQEPAESAGSR
jgi:acyl-coenzyme A synthetase/AMP-(fatty) acid ligase/peptidoglycan/LPS O-acetylase OafA/YrhL